MRDKQHNLYLSVKQRCGGAGAECLCWGIVGLPASTALVVPAALETWGQLCQRPGDGVEGQEEWEGKQVGGSWKVAGLSLVSFVVAWGVCV